MIRISRIGNLLTWVIRRLFEQSAIIVMTLAFICAGVMVRHVYDLRANLIESTTLSAAQFYSEAIATFRTLYTSEVVARARSKGIEVIHNYEEKDGAIPLPATLSMLLGRKIGEGADEAQVRLYSPYPFPWRSETGGLRTEFARQAWEYLQRDPEGIFYRFGEIGGAPVMLYASADRMREACVDCHNNHPDTPKADWKVGDLRGVLEVAMPLEGAIASTETDLRQTYFLAGALLLLTIAAMVLTVKKFRVINASLTTRSEELEALKLALDKEVEARTRALQQEIDERRRAEGEARDGEARYVAAIELMRDAHIIIDANGVMQSINGASEQIFGYARAEVLGQNVSMLLPESQQSAHKAWLDRYRKTGKANIIGKGRDTGLFGRRKDGSTFPISLLIERFETSEGVFFLGILGDITHRQEAEAKNRRLTTVVEQAGDCIAVMNTDYVIEYVNPQFEREYGYRSEEVVGKRSQDLDWRRSDDNVYVNLSATISRGKAWSGHLLSEARDGTMIEHDVIVSPIFDEAGDVTNYVHIGRNVTEKLQLERQLRQAQKLEAIGQLAAGIAHEINTPTQYVGDNTRFLQEACGDLDMLIDKFRELTANGDAAIPRSVVQQVLEDTDVEYLQKEIPRAVEQSLEGISRVSRIVRAMKEFSHPAQEKTAVDLNRAIESTITVATNEWKYVAEMETDLDPGLLPVFCLPGDFNQVLLNMLVNASHAIAEVVDDRAESKGTITVSTHQIDDWAEIRIADTGCGMPEDVKARIFDPFFTTKEVGKGTGQGLSIAYAVIVEKHGGTIAVDSEPGQGTCFTIRLPLNDPSSVDVTVAA